jgi:hypothetical protein
MLSSHGLWKVTYPGGGTGSTSHWSISRVVEKVVRDGKHRDWELEKMYLGDDFEKIKKEFEAITHDSVCRHREIGPVVANPDINPHRLMHDKRSKWERENANSEVVNREIELRLEREKQEEGLTARLNELEGPYSKEDGGRKDIVHHKLSWLTKGCESTDFSGRLVGLTI